MDEVHLDAIELRVEVIEAVQPALVRPPVEPVGPVGEQLLHIVKVGALLPANPR